MDVHITSVFRALGYPNIIKMTPTMAKSCKDAKEHKDLNKPPLPTWGVRRTMLCAEPHYIYVQYIVLWL